MAKVLDKELYSYFLQLNDAEKKSILQMIKAFLNGRKTTSVRIGMEQYNNEIDKAMDEIRRGEIYTHEEVMKMARKW